MVYNKENYDLWEVGAVACMKCGKKLGSSQVFCDECLEKMEQNPVNPNTVVTLPRRESASVQKKRPLHQRYFWNLEGENDTLRTKIRWLRFALVVAILGFLISVAVIFLLLQWQGRLDFVRHFLPF